jgi:hypothetical protein
MIKWHYVQPSINGVCLGKSKKKQTALYVLPELFSIFILRLPMQKWPLIHRNVP